MARYNAWQNNELIKVADDLTETELRRDRQARFKSIYGTFNHALWYDRIWMSRFTPAVDTPPGTIDASDDLFGDWNKFKQARYTLDEAIVAWTQEVQDDWFLGKVTWLSTIKGGMATTGRQIAVTDLFTYQAHCRGVLHGMLSAAGATPGLPNYWLLSVQT